MVAEYTLPTKITLKLGSETIISTEDISSTGYTWSFETDNYILDIKEHTIEDSNKYSLLIKAMNIGTENIIMRQSRPWLKDEPRNKYTIEVRVFK